MNEAYLRKWHRRMGIALALFIFVQAFSGVVLNWEILSSLPSLGYWANVLHRGGSDFGSLYRLLLGLGLAGMASSGSLIFFKTWQRTKKF